MVSVETLGQLVPGPASEEVDCFPSNNNLDICRHRERLFLAWRTAPTHFASARARLEVVSAPGPDGPWRHEQTVSLDADLREPRFVSDGDRLLLFFMELGSDPRRFQPRRTHRICYDGRQWDGPEVVIDEPIVPWRVRRIGDRWVMSTYRGAEKMYSPLPSDPIVELRYSDDLEKWSAPAPIHRGGTECEIVMLDDGSYVGVTRNEGPGRYGSDLLVGTGTEHFVSTAHPRKLDSPNLVVWDGEPWLFARRSLGFAGRYDVAPTWLPGVARIRANQLAWWMTRKRSALYRIDVEARTVDWVADLPSRGDTSFAGVVTDDDGSLLVADYSSPETSGDPRWVRGQLGTTVISVFRIRKES